MWLPTTYSEISRVHSAGVSRNSTPAVIHSALGFFSSSTQATLPLREYFLASEWNRIMFSSWGLVLRYFAVPTGTPVMAAGGGTINFMGWANGYGNFVVINHSDGYATAYGHLSRFAAGMKRGNKVHQGEVFAYSGMTGLATGPHLHYEIRVNGTQVNPLKVKMADGRLLAGAELRTYLELRLKMDQMLASTPLETKVADTATDLRQAKSK